MIGVTALALVVPGLAMTAWAQIRPLRRHRILLDTLAIVPEWRFYARASIGGAIDYARDTHLVVRDRDAGGGVGGWMAVLWPDERRLVHGLWNPGSAVDGAILSTAEDLALACTDGHPANVQQSLAYLVVLRRAFEAPRPARGDGIDRQFAVVHTIGRGRRSVSIDFLSAWHRW